MSAYIWIIIIAVFISAGRQFYMDVDSVEKKWLFRLRIFITEVITTSILLGVLYLIVKWIISLF